MASEQKQDTVAFVSVQKSYPPSYTLSQELKRSIRDWIGLLRRVRRHLVDEYLSGDTPLHVASELDIEDTLCSDYHLGQIADTMYEWEGRVADELKLTRAEVAKIRKKYPDRLDLQAKEALYTWKQKLGHEATYWNLCVAFFHAGHNDYSDTVLKTYLYSTPAAHDTCDISVKVAAVHQGGETTDVEDHEEDKKGWYSKLRSGVRKLFGAAKGLTEGFVKKALKSLNLDIFIRRKYKIRHDKYTDRHQERWWFELTGDESALKELESKWSQVSAEHKKWKLETCPATPQRH